VLLIEQPEPGKVAGILEKYNLKPGTAADRKYYLLILTRFGLGKKWW
jgi:hypothetical protein